MNTENTRRTIAEAGRALQQLGDSGSDPSAILGYALRWSSTAQGEKGPTRFNPSAFGSAPLTVPLLFSHDPSRPLGRATLVPDSVGLRVQARITPTTQGADVLALLRDGGVNGLSIGFRVLTSKQEAGVRVVTGADLDELSVVVFPADSAARVEQVGEDRVPQYHVADPREREVAVMNATDAMAEVHEAERQLRQLKGEPESEQLHPDVCGRLLTGDQLRVQRSARQLVALYTALQRDPSIAKMETHALMAYVEALDALK